MICWRQLDGRLWAGRALDHPIGTIERRHDFVFIDVGGTPHGGYSSLAEAKAAAERPNGPWPALQPMRWYAASRVRVVGLAGLATVMFAAMSAMIALRISF